jgi:hydroxyacylglutathione hydrolase
MPHTITAINLSGVNVYFINNGTSGVLIDTGMANQRAFLGKRLKDTGCLPGNLKLIILTHGDVDHTGNAAFLREKYGAKIGIHADEAGMIEHGDPGWNRKAKSDKASWVFRIMMIISPLFTRLAKPAVFKPDLLVDENSDLSIFGLDARVVHLPGHSKGSIGILTASGDLFCGDFIYTIPGFNLINDLAAHRSSFEKLKNLDIKMIYPGHGKPISIEQFRRRYRE